MSTFNLKQDVSIETAEAIAMTIRTGKPVYMTESGRLTTRKPAQPFVKILEPFDLSAYGVEFRKFAADEDYLGEHGGWGFKFKGEVLCFGHDADDKEYASQYIAGDLAYEHNLFTGMELRLQELEEVLTIASRHSYDSDDDYQCAVEQLDIPALMAGIE